MSMVLPDLARNLAGGARVVFGRPVSILGFRIGIAQLLVLFAFSALLDATVDTLRREPGSVLAIVGLVGVGFYGALLMLFAALLALLFRQPSLVLSLPVVVLASEWPLQAARMAIAIARFRRTVGEGRRISRRSYSPTIRGQLVSAAVLAVACWAAIRAWSW